jgi:hypothetical protein
MFSPPDPVDRTRIEIAASFYPKFGSKSILAWDFIRYISLCRWGYLAGFFSEREAWDEIMPAAVRLRQTFFPWELCVPAPAERILEPVAAASLGSGLRKRRAGCIRRIERPAHFCRAAAWSDLPLARSAGSAGTGNARAGHGAGSRLQVARPGGRFHWPRLTPVERISSEPWWS